MVSNLVRMSNIKMDDPSGENAVRGKDDKLDTYARITSSDRLPIIKMDFFSDRLTQTDCERILIRILELIDKIPCNTWLPIILTDNLVKGAYIFQFSDAKWLRGHFERMVLGRLNLRF